MNLKSWMKIMVLATATGGYIHHFYTNPKGVFRQRKLAQENEIEKNKIAALENKVSQLQQKTIALHSDWLEQEKIIRQDLQMSYTNEYVYLLRGKNKK